MFLWWIPKLFLLLNSRIFMDSMLFSEANIFVFCFLEVDVFCFLTLLHPASLLSYYRCIESNVDDWIIKIQILWFKSNLFQIDRWFFYVRIIALMVLYVQNEEIWHRSILKWWRMFLKVFSCFLFFTDIYPQKLIIVKC